MTGTPLPPPPSRRPLAGVAPAIARALRTAGGSGALRRLAGPFSGLTTLAAAALVGLLALAQPAMRRTAEPWRGNTELAVTFLDRTGVEIGHRGVRRDESVPLASLPPHLVDAVLATEDRRFREHWGLDPRGILRAALADLGAGAVVQGGSTISQQLAKILFLTGERSFGRKLDEAFLAVWLEVQLGKDAILKLYLDRAYLGSGAFGIAAASRTYFGKPATELGLPEAALLAGLLKAPSRLSPRADADASARRAATVLDAMVASGHLSAGLADEARLHPARPASSEAEASGSGYFLDAAYRELQGLAADHRLGSEANLIVATPFDPLLQEAAERSVASQLDRFGPDYGVREAALVAMEPDGLVRALVGGRDYGRSAFNRATESRRQPGSAFKPFVYAAALEAGWTPSSVVDDTPICLDGWCPANHGGGHAGWVPLWSAFARSLNTVPVALSIGLGAARHGSRSAAAADGRTRIADVARRLGIGSPLYDVPSLVLGTSEVTLLELTSAYAALAAGGRPARPATILQVSAPGGRVLYRREAPSGRPVLAASTVADLTAMMARVPEVGTGRRAAVPGLRSAGKTGTGTGYRDAWYVGFAADLVAGIWFGNDDFSPTRAMTGGTLPARAWHDLMGFARQHGLAHPLSDTVAAGLDGRGSTGGFAEVSAGAFGAFRELGLGPASFQVVR